MSEPTTPGALGSLYLMTLTGARWLGAITPLGGLSLILGWLALAAAALEKADRPI